MRRFLPLPCLLLAVFIGVTSIAAQQEADLFGRINALRASVGRGPYALNGALSAAAYNQAQWIVDTGNVSHTRPDGSGPRSRALAAGYPSTMVSENIYGGTNATADIAWNFWVNSGIHYAGLVNPSYNEVGVGVAHGAWGSAYVLVFGNNGGPPPPAPQSSSGGDSGSAAAGPPAYFVGVDENGYILHEIQPGDTLGDIALIYGYTWDDLPVLMSLNNIADVRDLEVGTVFRIPPHAGTYTPTPGGAVPVSNTQPPMQPPSSATPMPASITPYVALMPVQVATLIVTPLAALSQEAPSATAPSPPTPFPDGEGGNELPSSAQGEGTGSPLQADAGNPTPQPTVTGETSNTAPALLETNRVVTAAAPPTELAFLPSVTVTLTPSPSLTPTNTAVPATQVALANADTTNISANVASVDTPPARDNQPTWLMVAVGVQVAILIAAALEFARRSRRKGRESNRS
jgi:hypothetical protein